MSRDAAGRFKKQDRDGEAEPEAESAGAGLAAGQATLLAALTGKIAESKRRQEEARQTQLRAIEARLTALTAAGAGGGAGALTGEEGVAQRPLDLIEDFSTPHASQNAPGAVRRPAEAGNQGGGAVVSGARVRGRVRTAQQPSP